MKEFLLKLVSSNSGVSSKRVITLSATLVLFICLFLNQICGFQVSERIIEALEWVIIIGLGSTASERFGKKDNFTLDKPKDDNNNQMVN